MTCVTRQKRHLGFGVAQALVIQSRLGRGRIVSYEADGALALVREGLEGQDVYSLVSQVAAALAQHAMRLPSGR